MRYVFINRFFYPDHSATSQILSDLAFSMTERGASVAVVAARLSYDDPNALLPAQETIRGVDVHRIWTSRFGRLHLLGRAIDYLTFYLSALFVLMRVIQRDDVVIAKTDPPLISVLAALVCWIKGGRLVNWLQDVFPEVAAQLDIKGVRGPVASVLRKARNWSLRKARMNVTLGHRMKQKVVSEGIDPKRVCIIPNWSDDDRIKPIDHADNALRDYWNLTGKFVVGYSGNVGRVHEFGTILSAAESLRDDPNIVFLFIGSGAQLKGVREQVEQRALTNVMFKPYQLREHLQQSLGVSDAHFVSLNPALEGLVVPSKVYGICSAGRPVLFIGERGGEVDMLINRHDCGQTFQIGDSRALAAAILKMSRDPHLVARLGHNARRAIDVECSKELSMATWRSVLEAQAGRSTYATDLTVAGTAGPDSISAVSTLGPDSLTRR